MFRRVNVKNGLTLVENEEPVTKDFSEYGLKEKDIEDLLRSHVDLLIEDESLLIVGQQVTNSENGRNDLVAIDENGALVLIEIKRDASDCKVRKEPFEFQAIRYAASLATINSPEELVDLCFVRYIEKYSAEFQLQGLTSREFAIRRLSEFLSANDIDSEFNSYQRIFLVASSFERQTESAVSWLIKAGVDVSCFQIAPVELKNDIFLNIEKVIPPKDLDEYLVDFSNKATTSYSIGKKSHKKKQYLPRMDKLFEWGILKKGDVLSIKGKEDSDAKVIDSREVEFNGKKITYNQWGQLVMNWSSICIYEWAIHSGHGELLDVLRRKRMSEEEAA